MLKRLERQKDIAPFLWWPNIRGYQRHRHGKINFKKQRETVSETSQSSDYFHMNDAMRIMKLKESKGLVPLDQPKCLFKFNILLFLSDYKKKKKKKKRKMRCQSGLVYILTKEVLPSS